MFLYSEICKSLLYAVTYGLQDDIHSDHINSYFVKIYNMPLSRENS